MKLLMLITRTTWVLPKVLPHSFLEVFNIKLRNYLGFYTENLSFTKKKKNHFYLFNFLFLTNFSFSFIKGKFWVLHEIT